MTIIKDCDLRAAHYQVIHRFDNGYGASVIRGSYTYGGPGGLFELAVLRFTGAANHVCYDTPITNDILGYLTPESVASVLADIEALPS